MSRAVELLLNLTMILVSRRCNAAAIGIHTAFCAGQLPASTGLTNRCPFGYECFYETVASQVRGRVPCARRKAGFAVNTVGRRSPVSTMTQNTIDKCPSCGGSLERGFTAKASGLSFVPLAKFKRFAFVDEDLNRRSLLRRLFPSRARFSPSFICRSCQLYLVDYGTVLSRRQADEVAQSLEIQTR